MGTDIHIAVEIFYNGRWHLSDVTPTQDRNYRAFAVLANVRNGYGFGGFSTGDELKPISEPRGLPDDMSPELRAKIAQNESSDEIDEGQYFWLGDYGYSWVTLKELLEYDLDAPVLVSGYVSEEQAKHYQETGEFPRAYATWTPQPGFVKLSWPQPIRDSAPLIQTLIDEIRGLGAPENVRLVFGFDN